MFTSLGLSIALLASVHAALTPANLAETSTSGALSALRYTNVGGSGSYEMVTAAPPGTWPSCDVSPSCVKTTRAVSGNLAPFDEDLTVAFRGPLDLHNVHVYQPSNASGATWSRTSAWSAGQQADNLVFMNNKGGSVSGEWSICQGASQSYANADFTDAAASPGSITSGSIPAGQEANIMTAAACSNSTCDGFFRGTSNIGWAGSKFFIFEFSMPSSDAAHPPAIWTLNAQVVRSAQYECNCRGEGADGGCGELDLLEVLPGDGDTADHAISEIYSFKTATGTGDGNYFPRPSTDTVIYAVIFDVKTDQIAIQRLTAYDFSISAIPRSLVDGYLAAPARVVSMKTDKRGHRRGMLFPHRRSGAF